MTEAANDEIRVLRYDRGWYYVSRYRFHRTNRLQVGPFPTMEKALEAGEAETPPSSGKEGKEMRDCEESRKTGDGMYCPVYCEVCREWILPAEAETSHAGHEIAGLPLA